MRVFYARSAAKQLEDFPSSVQKRIVLKMRFFADQKNPLKFAKHLIDSREGDFRFRVGEHRVIFDVYKNVIFVLKIEKRDKAYD